MKRCPTCSRVYDNLSLRFCFDDGTELVNKVPEGGAPETALMNATVDEVVPTMKAANPPVFQNAPPSSLPAPARKRNLWPWLIGGTFGLIAIGALIVVAIVMLTRPALKWHLVMRVVPETSGDQAGVVNQTVAVLKNRLNAAGVTRFEIRPQGDQIFLDLPAVKDPERLKYLISTGGKLELVQVISPASPAPVATYKTQEEAIASLNSTGTVPPNRRLLSYAEREDYSSGARTWVVVEAPAIVNGGDLRDASATKRTSEEYDIMFSLNRAGAQKFGSWTGSHINEYIGVVLNDEVKSIAYIKSQITDQGQISGRFTKQRAEDLALVLRSGALPARLEFQEERIDK